MEGPVIFGLDHFLVLTIRDQKRCVLEEIEHDDQDEYGQKVSL